MRIFNWFRSKRETRAALGPLRGVDVVTLGGSVTNDSGETINSTTALASSAVNAAVRVISEDIAGLPWFVFRRDGNRREKAPEHPNYRLLHDTPNPDMTAFTFREVLARSLLLEGNAYAFLEKESARVVELWPLDPRRVHPFRRNGQLLYRVDGVGEPLWPDMLLHILGPSDNGIEGKSIVQQAANAIGVHLAADKLAGKFYANGTMLGGYLRHPGQLSDSARQHLKESFLGVAHGVQNAHGTAVLEEGMEYFPLGIKADEAQFLESRKWQIEDLARLFRVSPIKIGHLERSTFNNIEELSIDHVRSTLRPTVIRFEQEVQRKLFWEDEQAIFYNEMQIDGLLRGDQAARYQAYSIGRQQGFLNVNEIREMENWPSIGPQGDVYLSPLNMTPANQPPEPRFDPAPLIRAAHSRLLRKEINAVRRAWKKHENPAEFMEWAGEFYEGHRDLARQMFAPVGESTGQPLDTVADEHCNRSLGELAVACWDERPNIDTVLERWESRCTEEDD